MRAQARAALWDETLPPGALGENLTLTGLLEKDAWVGDVLRFADCELAVSEPRFPCFKFNAAMGFEQASALMSSNAWCGFYLQVRVAGTLRAGEAFEVVPGPREVGITELFRARVAAQRREACSRAAGPPSAALPRTRHLAARRMGLGGRTRGPTPRSEDMGIVSFFKEAGEKLFGHKEAEAAAAAAAQAPSQADLQERSAQANRAAASAIEGYIGTQNLAADGLERRVRRRQQHRHRGRRGARPGDEGEDPAVLRQRHRRGAGQRHDDGAEPADESQYHTVVRGTRCRRSPGLRQRQRVPEDLRGEQADVLTHPDKIYPGQLLRIPPA